MRGPIDYIIVGFTKNKFNGEILNALEEATANGTIEVLDLALIMKDEKGEVASVELSQIDDPIVAKFAKEKDITAGMIGDDDIEEVAELLENNTSAGLLVIEQLWAIPLKKAIMDVGGVLIAEGRIHPDAEKELNEKGE